MTKQWHIDDALPVGLDLEPWHTYVNDENLLSEPGVCMNPQCSRPFVPNRAHQVYCCEKCRLFGDQEFRKIGLRAAPGLLAHRLGKYAKQDRNEDLFLIGRAGRNYVSALQAAWVEDRARRAEHSEFNEGGDQ